MVASSSSALARGTVALSLSRRAALLPLLAAAGPSALRPAGASAPQVGYKTASGLRYFDFAEGSGAPPRFGQLIRFHYVGYTATDDSLEPFDSSYERRTPYFTKHGNGFTVQGLEEALHTMRPGGRRRVILPPKLSYTANKGPLPPGGAARDTLFSAVGRKVPRHSRHTP